MKKQPENLVEFIKKNIPPLDEQDLHLKEGDYFLAKWSNYEVENPKTGRYDKIETIEQYRNKEFFIVFARAEDKIDKYETIVILEEEREKNG